jgi:hypothetical protein
VGGRKAGSEGGVPERERVEGMYGACVREALIPRGRVQAQGR